MSEKIARHNFWVSIILACVTVANVIYTIASQPSAEMKRKVEIHDIRINGLQRGLAIDSTNIVNLQFTISNLVTDVRKDHEQESLRLEDIWKAVK